MEHKKVEINLIRKIAWSFNATTGVAFEELYSEASLAYCEAMNDWSPDRGTKFTTYAYTRMRYALAGFVRNRRVFYNTDDILEQGVTQTPFWEVKELLSDTAQIIVDTIFEDPHNYLEGQKGRANLRKEIVGSGLMKDWQFFRGCKEIKEFC